MQKLLEVENLEAFYGPRPVLQGISFFVPEGGAATILGANGAGKTTTLRALCKMIRTKGEIRFMGERIDGLATEDVVRRGIAHVPDGRGTFTDLSVEENLRVGAYTRRDNREVAADFERIWAYFPRLLERRQQQAGTLSGGEQQMLAIARALMLRPKLLLLDEPSFGLSPIMTSEIYRIMRQVLEEEHVAILLVEQNASLALDLAEEAWLIETGRVVVSGKSAEIREQETIRRSYLGY
jgi:branched-chain amino acid transport system ATP-binding protein